MEFTPAIGVGVSDLQHAVRAEVVRMLRETKGDPLAQSRMLIDRLEDLGLLSGKEVKAMTRLAELAHAAAAGKTGAKEAYFESRDLYNGLLGSGKASPVALVLASSAVGSYSIDDDPGGSGTVVFKKNTGEWENRGKLAGAVIGAAWGPMGAAIGGAVGGLVGAAVDDCKA